jgi:uncharacterized protein YozE (UPF0346 family)
MNWYWGWASDRLLTPSGQADYLVASRAAEAVKNKAIRNAYADFLLVERNPSTSSQEVEIADKIYSDLSTALTTREQEELARAFAFAANTHGLR